MNNKRNATTAFIQQIARCFIGCAELRDRALFEFILIHPLDQSFTEKHWMSLGFEVKHELEHRMKSQPEEALSLFTETVFAATADNALDLYALCSRSNCLTLLQHVTAASVLPPGARHAFATALLIESHQEDERETMARYTSLIAGKTVALTEHRSDLWKNDMLLAFFGPAWHALYGDQVSTDPDIITHVLHAQPPFAIDVRRAFSPMPMPNDMAP